MNEPTQTTPPTTNPARTLARRRPGVYWHLANWVRAGQSRDEVLRAIAPLSDEGIAGLIVDAVDQLMAERSAA